MKIEIDTSRVKHQVCLRGDIHLTDTPIKWKWIEFRNRSDLDLWIRGCGRDAYNAGYRFADVSISGPVIETIVLSDYL